MTYSIGLTKLVRSPLSVTPPPFLSEIVRNHILNKTVCSVMKNVNATLMFSV
jgi:hypothetical protein